MSWDMVFVNYNTLDCPSPFVPGNARDQLIIIIIIIIYATNVGIFPISESWW